MNPDPRPAEIVSSIAQTVEWHRPRCRIFHDDGSVIQLLFRSSRPLGDNQLWYVVQASWWSITYMESRYFHWLCCLDLQLHLPSLDRGTSVHLEPSKYFQDIMCRHCLLTIRN